MKDTLIQTYKNTFLEKLKESDYADKTIVFGEGSLDAKVVLVGEAPGRFEEMERRPFIGKAGQILSDFLAVSGLSRDEIYITNTVKFRPVKLNSKTQKTANRTPVKSEIEFCKEFLSEEILTVNPDLIITLGNIPLKALLANTARIGHCHGTLQKKNDFLIFPLYHPAAIIYNKNLKETYINDLYLLKKFLLCPYID